MASVEVAAMIEIDGVGKLLSFFCPGCREYHNIPVSRPDGVDGPVWDWNGSLEKPTLNPSILSRYVSMTQEGWRQYNEWREGKSPVPENGKFDSVDVVCHLFVKGGLAEFLRDCTHAAAGKLLPLVPVSEMRD